MHAATWSSAAMLKVKIQIITLVGVLAVLTAGAAISILRQGSQPRQSAELAEAFARWKVQYGKLYATPSESDYRLKVFGKTTAFIQKENVEYEARAAARGEKLSGPMFEMNGFGDLTREEFTAMYAGLSQPIEEFIQIDDVPDVEADQNPVYNTESNLGSSFVPRPRAQGKCQSCWAFGAIVELERLAHKKHGSYIDLSHQELLDCAGDQLTCRGGQPAPAFNYARKRGGLHKASSYPYLAAKKTCENSKAGHVAFSIPADATNVPFTTAKATTLSSKGIMPATLVYSSGAMVYLSKTDDVFDARGHADCSKARDHTVAIVSSSAGVSKVVNSWFGTKWAAGGFKKIRACSSDNLFGTGGRLVYPHSF